MIAASDTLSPRCGLCLPTAEDWPTVAMPPAAVGRPAACAEGCGRVAYWLVAVPTYRPLGAPVNRQVARLLHEGWKQYDAHRTPREARRPIPGRDDPRGAPRSHSP